MQRPWTQGLGLSRKQGLPFRPSPGHGSSILRPLDLSLAGRWPGRVAEPPGSGIGGAQRHLPPPSCTSP